MSRVLVTGATGFVGRQVIRPLLEAGHEVHAVARRPGEPRPGVHWHAVDLLTSPRMVSEIRADVLVHLAWCTEHGAFWTSPENVRWAECSLALIRAFGEAGGRRAVVAGTCAEYEWSRDVYPEDALRRPSTLYGKSKNALHEAARAEADEHRLALAWGRVFFCYGPHESPGRFVSSLAQRLLSGRRAPMTDGTQVRDFLHVSDLGRAFAACADSSVTGAVNLASGCGIALRDLGALIANASGNQGGLDIGALPAREGDPPSLVADTRRLREEVGFAPTVDLSAGIADAVAWWREQLSAEPRDGGA